MLFLLLSPCQCTYVLAEIILLLVGTPTSISSSSRKLIIKTTTATNAGCGVLENQLKTIV